jgi:tRNA-guanine family transglycosylase
MSFTFDVAKRSLRSLARVGRITTTHGSIETPAFVPVATHGTLKGVDPVLASRITQTMFVNTFHAIVNPPGVDAIAKCGGLHKFMNYDRPLLTDSGGFQSFSLAGDSAPPAVGERQVELKGQQRGRYEPSVMRVTEDGVLFKSYVNGDEIWLTPESSVQAQQKLGADIIIPLDELPVGTVSRSVSVYLLCSRPTVYRAALWRRRCKERIGGKRGALLSIALYLIRIKQCNVAGDMRGRVITDCVGMVSCMAARMPTCAPSR